MLYTVFHVSVILYSNHEELVRTVVCLYPYPLTSPLMITLQATGATQITDTCLWLRGRVVNIIIITPSLQRSQAGSHSAIKPPKAHHQTTCHLWMSRALAARAPDSSGKNRERDPAIKVSAAIKLLPLLRTALCVTAKHFPWLIKPSSGALRAIKSLAKWLHFIH